VEREGSLGGADRLGLGGPETEREHGLASSTVVLSEVELGHLHDVAVRRRVVD
jgi:hypothetical protein